MTSHRIRVSIALIAALVVAACIQFAAGYIGDIDIDDRPAAAQFLSALIQTFSFATPLAIGFAVMTELARLRSWQVQIAIGMVVAALAGHLAVRGEPLTSELFAGGALASLGLFSSGAIAALTYWSIAGRRAGWQGDAIEMEAGRIRTAYVRASENAKAEMCRPCLLAWAALSLATFSAFAWLTIGAFGLHHALLAETTRAGKAALAASGFSWATFKISDHRAIIEGEAPDELQKRLAHDRVRETLHAVVGFPGVLRRIDDQAVARADHAGLAQKMLEVKMREQQAAQAIEDARRLAEAARMAGAEAGQNAHHRPQSTDGERTPAADSEDAHLAAVLPTAPRQTAEALAQIFDNAHAPAHDTEHSVAAVHVEAPSADRVGAASPPEAVGGDACTGPDLALVESSQVGFEPQSFLIEPAEQRVLDRVAASIERCQTQSILISGTADTNADRLFNPALGHQRAEAVRAALIARGVAETRIATKTLVVAFTGDTSDAAPQRKALRRADFKLVERTDLDRDATQRPDERAANCETDLSTIMAQSIIHFPMASARVSEESHGVVTKIAGAIQTCGSVIVTVEGHTDKIGTDERNQRLSVARANAVREALIAVGVDPTRIASRGFAATRPYATEETEEAFALNRRIEFKVSGKFTSTAAGGP